MTTTTIRDVITKALQKNGVLTQGQSPSAGEASDGFDALLDMVDSWANDSLLCFAKVTESFTLTSNVGTYNIGTGQTFNTVLPTIITSAYVRQVTTDYPLEPINVDEYNNLLQDKSILGLPTAINYVSGYPIGQIRLYPVPSINYTLFLTSEKPLNSFSSIDTVISLPPGWKRAMVHNLSLEISPDYNQPITPAMAMLAKESLGNLRRTVIRNRGTDSNYGTYGRPNIYSGDI